MISIRKKAKSVWAALIGLLLLLNPASVFANINPNTQILSNSSNTVINNIWGTDNQLSVITPDSRSNVFPNDMLGNYPIAGNGVDLLIPLPAMHNTGGNIIPNTAWFDLQLTNARFFFDTRFTRSGRQILQLAERYEETTDLPQPEPPSDSSDDDNNDEDIGNDDNSNEPGNDGNNTPSNNNINLTNTPTLILGEEVYNQHGAGLFNVGSNIFLYPGERISWQFSHWTILPREMVFIPQFGIVDRNGTEIQNRTVHFTMPPVHLDITAHWTPAPTSGIRNVVGNIDSIRSAGSTSLLPQWGRSFLIPPAITTSTAQATNTSQATAQPTATTQPTTHPFTPGFVIEDGQGFLTNQTIIGRTIRHYGLNNEIPFYLTILNHNTIRISYNTADTTAHNQFLRIPIVMQRTGGGYVYAHAINRSTNMPVFFNTNGYRLSATTITNEEPPSDNDQPPQTTSTIELISGVATIPAGRTEIPRATRRAGFYTLDVRNAQGITFRLTDITSSTFTLQNNNTAIAAIRIDGITYANVVGAYVPEYLEWANHGRAVTLRNIEDAEVTFYISAHADFTGHADITWTGGRTRIASIVPAIDVRTQTTTLTQGTTNQRLEDIIIEETTAGTLGGTIGFEIENLTLLPHWQVSATGSMDIRRDGANNLRIFSRSSSNARNTPATIAISDMAVNIPADTPLGYKTLTITNITDNTSYALNGDLRSNQQGFHRFAFNTQSDIVIQDFIRITAPYTPDAPGASETPTQYTPDTPTPNNQAPQAPPSTIVTPPAHQNLHITISPNRPYAIVNSRQIPLTTGSYTNADITPPILWGNRLYVPLRALGLLFGDNVQISWNDHTRVATITMNDITTTFQANSDIYTVNGNPRLMDATAFIATDKHSPNPSSHNRMYVPFRFLGYAFGFDVSWDAQHSEAHFNYTGSLFNVFRVG